MSWAIRLTYPDGRHRYEAEDRYALAATIDDAGLYPSKRQAVERCRAYRDARLVYRITAEAIEINGSHK